MKWVTHIITAICFAVLVSIFIPISTVALILVALTSILPDYLDIVTRARHRGLYSHNLLVPLGALPLLYHPLLSGFVIGYGHHLIIDMLTKQGVFIGRKRIKGFLYSNNITHNVGVILLHYFALLVYLTS